MNCFAEMIWGCENGTWRGNSVRQKQRQNEGQKLQQE